MNERPHSVQPVWFLLPKIAAVAVVLGSFASALVLILATPLRDLDDWQGLVDTISRLFKLLIVPGSFLVVVLSLALAWKHRRWYFRRRWAQVKTALLVLALPATHLAARDVFSAIRREVADGSPEGPTGLLQAFTALVVASILVLVVAIWLARFKPRLGQR